MNLLKMEITNCLKRREIHFVFLFVIFISILAFVIECLAFYGSDIKFVRSSAESSIFQGTYASSVRQTLFFILPLLSSIIYSDSLHVDSNNGIIKNILVRESKTKYIVIKAFTIFSTSLLVFFFALLINLLLTSITFPKNGFDNIYSLPPYDIGVFNYNKDYFLDNVRIQNPFIFNLISAGIISVFAGLISLFSFAFYFWFLSKHRIFGIFFTFLLYILVNISLSILQLKNLVIINILNPIHQGTLIEILSIVILFLLILTFLIKNKGIDKEWILEK